MNLFAFFSLKGQAFNQINYQLSIVNYPLVKASKVWSNSVTAIADQPPSPQRPCRRIKRNEKAWG
jgi:hypothetical protein